MTIDYTKEGLSLGYLIRGKYHDSAGVAQTLRLCGPSFRMGTGGTFPDPDEAGTFPDMQHWRAGVSGITLGDDIGKLDQYIQIPGDLSLTIPLGYPADPSSEVTATDSDATLREHAVSGRWANRDVDLWLIDLSTGDTEHRFGGFWDRDAQCAPGVMSLKAKASPGILATPWKMTTIPQDVSAWTPSGTLNSANLYKSPDTAASGRGFQLQPEKLGALVGCVWGFNDAIGSTVPGEVWRELAYYGGTTGFAGLGPPPVGNLTDAVFWFHVSPQYGCGISALRLVGDDGSVYQSLGSGTGVTAVSAPLVGHNYDAALGPLGSFCCVQVGTTIAGNFDPAVNSNKIYARINGPGADPTTVEWHATYGDPFTTLSGLGGAMSPAVELAWDVIEEIVEGSAFLNTSLLGTSAITDFATANPSSVAEYPEMLCAVPVEVQDSTEITYRDVLSNLVGALPADLIWRFDSTAKARRLYPWWRQPQAATTTADHDVYDYDLVSSQGPSIRQMSDPKGEYSNDVNVLAPQFIVQPAYEPTNADLMEQRGRNSERVENATEQGATKAAAVFSSERSWKFWSPHSAATGREHSRFVGAELSQPQTWVEATIGGALAFSIELGDTVQYNIQGITERIGQLRRLVYDLEAQTVTASSIHITFYDTDDVGGGD